MFLLHLVVLGVSFYRTSNFQIRWWPFFCEPNKFNSTFYFKVRVSSKAVQFSRKVKTNKYNMIFFYLDTYVKVVFFFISGNLEITLS